MRVTTWVYDDVANKIVATFEEMPPADHPDPVNFISEQTFTVELRPENVKRVKRAKGGVAGGTTGTGTA